MNKRIKIIHNDEDEIIRSQPIHAIYYASCIDWLYQFGTQPWNLHRSTIHLAITFLQRFLLKQTSMFPVSQAQLLTITSLFIASKIEEDDIQKINIYAESTFGTCSTQDIILFEKEMVETLDYRLIVDTPYSFLRLFLYRMNLEPTTQLSETLDLIMMDAANTQFNADVLAATVLYICNVADESCIWIATGLQQREILLCFQTFEYATKLVVDNVSKIYQGIQTKNPYLLDLVREQYSSNSHISK